MKLYRSFYAQVGAPAARERLFAFMTQAGYALVSDTGSLVFKRGSILGAVLSFNPLRWACTAHVSLTARGGNLTEFNVRYAMTNDPFENRFAGELLASESRNLEAAVSKNQTAALDVAALTRRIGTNVYRVISSLLGIIMAGYLGWFTGNLLFNRSGFSALTSSLIGAGIFVVLGATVVWAFIRTSREK